MHGAGRQGREDPDRPGDARLRAALAAWLADRSSRPGAGSAALFTSARGTQMTADALADLITAITTAAGMEDHVTSHVLRHTFGTELTAAVPTW